MADENNKKSKPVFKIGYWKIRGLMSPITYLLEYLGLQYENEFYESYEKWAADKFNIGLDFPNLPYMFHGDVKLTESQAIMRYICNLHDPTLLGKTIEDKALMDMAYFALADIKSAATTPCYTTGDREFIKEKIFAGLPKISKFLGDKPYVIGDYVTLVDFFLFENEDFYEFLTEGQIYKQFPNLKEHHERMSKLPKFGEFLKSDRFMTRPFNGHSAKINN